MGCNFLLSRIYKNHFLQFYVFIGVLIEGYNNLLQRYLRKKRGLYEGAIFCPLLINLYVSDLSVLDIIFSICL